MKKKILIAASLVLCAALLVVSSVLGTLAFLASSTAVSNTFTVGNVGIAMFESKTDKDGNNIEGVQNKKTSDGNSYELIPGKTYLKDPTIYVDAGSTSSYLFVKVKNDIKTVEDSTKTMKSQMIANGWQLIKTNAAGDELYLYVGFDENDTTKAVETLQSGEVKYKTVGSAVNESYDIFESFTIDQNATVTDFAGAKVTLTAFAIQVEGYTEKKNGLEGYQRAWNAIVGRFPFESGTAYTAADGTNDSTQDDGTVDDTNGTINGGNA